MHERQTCQQHTDFPGAKGTDDLLSTLANVLPRGDLANIPVHRERVVLSNAVDALRQLVQVLCHVPHT
ncbi:hypothetical protein GCM10023190_15980 [Enteractinococcus fodinae]